jgi:hypothetical protein
MRVAATHMLAHEPAALRHAKMSVQHYGARASAPTVPYIHRKAQCACGGGCPRCKEESIDPRLQTKLNISTPGDVHEQGADRIADQVMRMTESHADEGALLTPGNSSSTVSRKSATCEGASHWADNEVAQSVVSPGAGQPLAESERAFFEPRFGHDFSGVRVHADAHAAELAQSVNARAYTIGNDVVFGAGEWFPHTTAGQTLLAHELAHVVQQTDGAPPMIRRALVLEEEAPPADDTFWKNEVDAPPDDFWKEDRAPTGDAIPLEEPNKAPSCDDVCGNTKEKCVQEPGEVCSDDMSKKVMTAWRLAAQQLAMAIDAMAADPLSATTLASLKANFNWSPGNSPTDLTTTVSTNLSTASTKMSDNLCLKCLKECPAGASAQIARARGVNCLGSNCFRICPNFTEDDTHVLLHELFHRVVSSVEDLYRGQSGYPPPPPIAVKMPDCYASLIDDVAPRAAAKKELAKQKP